MLLHRGASPRYHQEKVIIEGLFRFSIQIIVNIVGILAVHPELSSGLLNDIERKKDNNACIFTCSVPVFTKTMG
ncbi:hypothetical protein XCR1_810036 [Xenorhabdus cabanillasii JM26]|uniref:Uncharacterized protein n=1 Tax=Xenorhabdus cabanillasii JM26 TaxID=1427517 RepID=W1JAG7_9GAMM|nr:hypothetical protein XCR1_810036 [Xenorhabdus cabanillasii JM26]